MSAVSGQQALRARARLLTSGLVVGDFELLDAWCAGDQGAGNTLFGRHFDALVRFFFNKVEQAECEDLVQRTLLACVSSKTRFRRHSSFRTFLFGIARNELLMFYRTLGQRPDTNFSTHSVADLGTSPSANVAREQEHALLLDALHRLPVDTQMLIELHYWEDLDAAALAELFEIDPTTVRTRLHRARARLRQLIAELEQSAPLRELAFEGLSSCGARLRSGQA